MILQSEPMQAGARVAIGSAAGAAVAGLIAPLLRSSFPVPEGGVGFVTIHNYPKGWDYAVVALLVAGSLIGGLLATARTATVGQPPTTVIRPRAWPAALTLFLLMLFLHDHPYSIMDMFHEGEHLTPAFELRRGERPYAETFFLHGLAVDGGLDALVLGEPPSPRRVRRMQTILDAATVALLAGIAAEVCLSALGLWGAVAASFCAVAAGQLPVFPYFRLAPFLLAVLFMLRYALSTRLRELAAALIVASVGILWSLDTGTYAFAGVLITGTAIIALARSRRAAVGALPALAAACLAPILILLAVRADLSRFILDSFVIIPSAIDAVWSLPAPSQLSLEALRYYLPPVVYGALLAWAVREWRRGARLRALQIFIVASFSILLFRTAAGRVSWSHTRFAMPLFGIAVVAFVIEPLLHLRRRATALALTMAMVVMVEVIPNMVTGVRLLANWPSRQKHEGLVRYPLRTGKGIYTTPANAADLAALNGLIASYGKEATFFDFSGERALYYLLERLPPARCADVSMLSAPALLAEAIAELEANRPCCVVLQGTPEWGAFDGVPNSQRVPELARWIEANYPRRLQIGRYLVAVRESSAPGGPAARRDIVTAEPMRGGRLSQ